MQYGPDTFFLRMADTSTSPRFEDGDFLWVDPDEPAEDGRFVAMDGRRVLRALCGDWPEPDAGNETMILGVVVFGAAPERGDLALELDRTELPDTQDILRLVENSAFLLIRLSCTRDKRTTGPVLPRTRGAA